MSDPEDVLREVRQGFTEGKLSRRAFFARAGAAGAAVAGLALAGTTVGSLLTGQGAQAATWWVPDESMPQKRMWMAWPSSTSIWGSLLSGIQNNVALVAKTIAKYQPVIMCADGSTAASTAASKCGSTVTVISSIPVNDCWMRDTGPLFRVNATGGRDAFGLNFNGWGGMQTFGKDQYVAERVAAYAGVAFSKATVNGEGGAVTYDGDGTLIATESSWVDSARNGSKTRATIEAELLNRYGATKMIWFPGIRNQDITDDHIDGSTMLVGPGVTANAYPLASDTSVYANEERQIYDALATLTDAKGRTFTRNKLNNPDMTKSRIGANNQDAINFYVNYAVCNGAVITNNFGDTAADAAAKTVLQGLYPGRVIEMLNIDNLIAYAGGGVHCITMNEPLPLSGSPTPPPPSPSPSSSPPPC